MHFIIINLFVKDVKCFDGYLKYFLFLTFLGQNIHNLRYKFFMRIDKFLKVSRLLKRRTVAQEACGGGRVSVNGRAVKPSCRIKEGDVVELAFNSGTVKFKVLMIKDTVRKEQAEQMYEILVD